jgi:hypothetical protein
MEGAVTRIDADAQQNAAIVEETASAASILHQQVSSLMNSVSHFKFGAEERPTAVHTADEPVIDQLDLNRAA